MPMVQGLSIIHAIIIALEKKKGGEFQDGG
jgi:hypothetical protein